jgi:hypothetical protein
VFGLHVLIAAAVDLAAPPANVAPSNAHLSSILSNYEKAAGRLAPGVPNVSVEDWSFTALGQTGTEHIERSGTDYRSTITTGPFTESYGQFNGVRWHKDYNGFTSGMLQNDTRSFAPFRVLDDLSDAKNDVSLQGETSGDAAAYVIKVTLPQHKYPEWVFVDQKTSLITRVEWIFGKRRIVNTYDDYRITSGLEQPWHIHDSDGRAQLDRNWKRTALSHPASVDFGQFAPPPSTPNIGLGFSDATALPAKIGYGNTFIVRVSTQGRGLDFLIDSATRISVIDRDVARELGLPTFGATTRLDDGTDLNYTTMIDDATVGPLRFRNFVLEATHYHYNATPQIKVVGVLGYDFLAGLVLHADYVDGTLELIPRDRFSGENPVADAFTVPFVLDDGEPMVAMGIGEGVARHTAIDTAVPYTIVFGPYIDAHPSDFTDLPHQERKQTFVPFADETSYGTQATVWLTLSSHLRFGPVDYQRVTTVATNFPFENGNADAIVGTDYLRFFDVYLDYGGSRIILKPNKWFYEKFHKD